MQRDTVTETVEPEAGRERRLRGTLGVALVAAAAVLAATVTTLVATSDRPQVTEAPVVEFQAAGDVGGGVLEPGTTYPPTTQGSATLKRGTDWIEVDIRTSGLPAGAYTVWWVIFDTPAGCSDDCGEDDLFNEDANVSAFFATGGVVDEEGTATFVARHRVGGGLGEPDIQHILGDGSLDPSRAEIHNVIKYHGPASGDPETLQAQLSTLGGSCGEGANALDLRPPFGVQCFDPQSVVHPAP